MAGFADATGRFLPLVATLNAARVLTATAGLLGVDLARLDELALSARGQRRAGPAAVPGRRAHPGPAGRARPAARADAGPTRRPAHLARAAVEGMLCGLADGVDALRAQGVRIERALLIGGGARSAAVRALAPAVLGVPVLLPEPAEYVALGAARQAAWALAGDAGAAAVVGAGRAAAGRDPARPGLRRAYADTLAAARRCSSTDRFRPQMGLAARDHPDGAGHTARWRNPAWRSFVRRTRSRRACSGCCATTVRAPVPSWATRWSCPGPGSRSSSTG